MAQNAVHGNVQGNNIICVSLIGYVAKRKLDRKRDTTLVAVGNWELGMYCQSLQDGCC
jgi:hypothetical protein